MSLDEVQRALLGLCRRWFPRQESVQVHDLARISDGWETDVYTFAVERGKVGEREREELILRLYPGDDAADKSAREFSVMQKLHQAGYPVPQVLRLEQENSPFGKPFVIMERIDGRPMGTVIDESPMEKKLELLAQFCQMFVDLHALDWRPFAPDPSPYETQDLSELIGQGLIQWQADIHARENTAFDPVFDWLHERLPEIQFGQPSVIHWDFHPYNILVRDDGAAYVIDWTNMMVADYRLDLAWTLLLMSAYGNPEARQIVLGEYERAAGHSVKQIEYFEVTACLRRLATIVISLGSGADKLGMRPGAETMMKNVGHIESVHALLRERTGLTVEEVEELLSALS
jgi:aminoglycoside phosphotransferase (APT) family kinase protein